MRTQASIQEQGGLRVARRATLHRADGSSETRSLTDWSALDAYVLLGDPGAGKSCSFESESAACNGLLIQARDIVDGVAPAAIEDRVVFIDGLDEVRAGASNSKTPFGAIREWLLRVGRPRFRLSCREADWLGESDQSALARVASNEKVEVLHLDPLQQDEALAILRDRSTEVANHEAFWQQAEQFGLTELFGNPLLLDLTIKAVAAGGGWPRTRQGIYEAACRQLAMESSVEHLAVNRPPPGEVDRLLDDAGLLCAVLLLSGKQSWSPQSGTPTDSVALSTLPAALPLHNARAALASKVFTTVAGQSTPRHRSIAEYLAAKALAKRLNEGLPLGRVLALMLGFDGKPVEPMRGLLAWLVAQHVRDRSQLIHLDPLGIVLNGDVAALSTSERLELLQALSDAARQDKNFRRNAWVSHPFGPLATADMEPTYDALLRKPERSDEHQAFIDCVLDALCHGEKMPALVQPLETWVEDASAWIGNRLTAYQAWKHHADPHSHPVKQREWLEQFFSDALADSEDRLTGILLTDLYPEHLGPGEVLKFLRRPKRRNLIAEHSMFWSRKLLKQSRHEDFAALADSWVEIRPTPEDETLDYTARTLSGVILAAALHHAGDDVSTARLYAWLGICIDAHGFSKLVDDSLRDVAAWLEQRPDRMKAVVALGFQITRPDEHGRRFFWKAEQRLHGARKPRDWLNWLLEQAATTNDKELAQDCFFQVAYAVVNSPMTFDVPSMEEVGLWVGAHSAKWPQAPEWLQDAWTSKIEDSRGDSHRRELKRKAQQLQEREKRKRDLEPYVKALTDGTASLGLLHQLALAHNKRFTNNYGDTALERVQDFLVSDAKTAEAALLSIDSVFTREDLPTVDDIFKLEGKRRYHLVMPAALVAATRSVEREPDAPLGWPEELTQKLVAFYLADGTGNMPDWYKVLAEHRPERVAPILIQYAAAKLKRKGSPFISGLWALSKEPSQQQLAGLVLPPLLDKFPLRASEPSRSELNRSLLSALHLIDDRRAATIIRLKLAQPGLDAAQRICWLVADLPHRAQAAADLAKWVGKNERRAAALGVALYEQGSLGRTLHRLSETAVRRLIEVLAPITPSDFGWRSGTVTAANHREDIVRSLFNALSSNPSNAARDQLRDLSESSHLGKWSDLVKYNQRAQQSVAREALFQAADPASVALVIANLAPANAADLLALVVEHLRDLEGKLRGTDTFLLRQFWQTKTEGNAPHEENYCRDLLLEKLRDRLMPLNVHVEREASAAADKRPDARAEYMRAGQRIAVPIEVKKENERHLWTAWRDQLQRLYSNDPAADSYGLYLVLWFGHGPRSTPEGVKPTDAQHLQKLIVERMSESDLTRLKVVVLDLSL